MGNVPEAVLAQALIYAAATKNCSMEAAENSMLVLALVDKHDNLIIGIDCGMSLVGMSIADAVDFVNSLSADEGSGIATAN